MCQVSNVIEYPEGFAIITDTAGRYLAFSETDSIVSIDDDSWPEQPLVKLKKTNPHPELEDEELDQFSYH